MALRLSGQLLLGASRIYWRKARYLLEDCGETLDRLKLNFKVDGQVDLPHDQARAPVSHITMSTNYSSATNALMLPEPDLDLDEILNMVSTQQPGKIVGKENDNSINLKEKFNMNKPFGFEKSDHNDSVFQAFPMHEDFEIEAGRRLTDLSGMGMSRDSNPFISRDSITTSAFGLEDPSAIEIGRKELSVTSAFSPMRLSTPGKMANEPQGDNMDMNDNFSWDAAEDHAAVASPLGLAPFNTPPRPTAAKATRKRKAVLDEVTEFSSSQIQIQVKDTSDIVLRKAAVSLSDNSAVLPSSNSAAPENIAAMLARPAFDGDMIMEAFGDLFKDNPLAISALQVTNPIAPIRNKNIPQTETSPVQATFAEEIREDYIPYDDDSSAFDSHNIAPIRDSSTSINVLEIIAASNSTVDFCSVVAGQARSAVAKAFFDVLVLSSKGIVKAEQLESFGSISLASGRD
jgi:hypothetical protein